MPGERTKDGMPHMASQVWIYIDYSKHDHVYMQYVHFVTGTWTQIRTASNIMQWLITDTQTALGQNRNITRKIRWQQELFNESNGQEAATCDW